MFIHANIVKAAYGALDEIFIKGTQSDEAVAAMLVENPKWGARDRNQSTGIVYNIVRNYIKYCYYGGVSAPLTDASIVMLINVYALEAELTLPEQFKKEIDIELFSQRKQEANDQRHLRLSIPQWLDNKGFAQLGMRWETELNSMNSEAKFCLRVNTIRARVQDVLAELSAQNIEFTRADGVSEGVVLGKRYNLKNNPVYTNGWVEIQDISSQKVALAVDVKPNMRVLDACAGAGGKTLHLAALMQNNGQIIATDISPAKLNILQIRARRADVHIVHTFKINETFIKNNFEAFDRILIDAPCSSLGTLRRKPDLKHSLTEEKFKGIIDIQQKILDQYSAMLKPKGILVYSTCSILPEENQQQIEKFLKTRPQYTLIKEESVSPADSGFDGFYIACLQSKY